MYVKFGSAVITELAYKNPLIICLLHEWGTECFLYIVVQTGDRYNQ